MNDAETLYIEYDPAKVQYEDLLRYFWRIHDPTTLNRQGGDVGTQYRSAGNLLHDRYSLVIDRSL